MKRWPGRHPGHRVRGADAPARARPSTPSCARPPRWWPWPRWGRPATSAADDARAWPAPTACCAGSSTPSRSRTSARRTRCPPTVTSAGASPGSSATGARPRPGRPRRSTATSARTRNLVRSIHERLYFRPLLDALAGGGAPCPPRRQPRPLAGFGFADVERTRAAVRELTRGLTRSSRMMRQLLPLVLDWLSNSPDPDLGLLGLRKLASGEQRVPALAHAFRDSPEVARRLCELLGTSALLGDILVANPDLIPRLADPGRLQILDRGRLVARPPARWRGGRPGRAAAGLRRWRHRHLLGIGARDVFGQADVDDGRPRPRALAEACVESALAGLAPAVPVGGGGAGPVRRRRAVLRQRPRRALRARGHRRPARACGWRRGWCGSWPAPRRPTASTRSTPRSGPRAARGAVAQPGGLRRLPRPLGADLGAPGAPEGPPGGGRPRLGGGSWTSWPGPCGTGRSPEDEREIRRMKARIERERIPRRGPRVPPQAGPGLAVRRRVDRAAAAAAHRGALALDDGGPGGSGGGGRAGADAEVLGDAYRFCERARNRWWLVGPARRQPDALPQRPADLSHLAASLGTTGARPAGGLPARHRRARRVVERLFYGTDVRGPVPR